MRRKSLGIVLATLALIAALLLSLAGCGEDPAPGPDDHPTPAPTTTSGAEAGVYYFDAGEGEEYLLTLGGNCHFTLAVKTSAEDGSYTLADGTLTLTAGSIARTAKLEGNVITLTYNDTQLRFLKKAYYTVTYNTDGGSVTSPVTVLNGKTLKTPADPTKDGYVFLGWYTDAECKTPFAFDGTPVLADMTLYARFAPKSADAKEYTVHYDLGYAGATLPDAATIGGKLYDAAVPTRDGYTFVGWWMSDTNRADKLTARFVGAEAQDATLFTEDTTLYAVWQKADATTATPAVSVSAKAASWDSVGAAAYLVTVTAPDGTALANAQRVTGTTFPLTLGEAGEYKIEVVAVNAGGTAISDTATRYYTHLALSRVGDFFVTDSSVLVFRSADGAEHYYITVDCGNPDHVHTAFDNGTSTCFNFFGCEMKKGGITFTVTATAKGRASSTATFVYERHLDAARDLVVKDGTLSWEAVRGATYYLVKIGDTTVNVTGTELSLLSLANGDYTASVTPVTRGYNSPDAATLSFTKTAPAVPKHLRLVGTVLSWDAVPGADSYEVKFGDKTLTVEAGKTEVDLAAAEVALAEGSDYTVTLKVTAAGGSAETAVTVRYHEMKDDLSYRAGKLTWTPVLGADSYEVQVENGEIFTVVGNSFRTFDTLAKAGENTLRVRFKSGSFTSEWKETKVYAYTVTLDSRGGNKGAPLYKAVGDPMTLPAPEKDGYVFAAWYNVPGGAESNGRKYADPYFAESGEMVLYAYYTSKTYTLTLSAGDDEDKTASVLYGKNYKLPVPATSSATASFGGWFSAPNGSGIAYTDTDGNSLSPWNYLDDNVMLYAFWVDGVFTFEKVGNGYAVSAGPRIDLVTSVTIPAEYRGEKVRIIARGAFTSRETLSELRIPSSIEEIASGAFDGCKNLASVEVYDAKEASPRYSSSDGVLFERGTSGARHPVYMPAAKSGVYTIPAGTDVIPDRAFAGSRLTKIIIPSSVREIGTEAFAECELLTSVVFENAGATAGVPALTVGDRAFLKCKELTSMVLPARLGSIPLVRYELSDGEFSEENTPNAFEGCGIAELSVAKGHNARFISEDGVLFGDYGATLLYFPTYKKVKDYVIPEAVTKIAEGAFYGCRYFEGALTIPARIAEIGTAAFRGDYGLTTLTFAGAEVPAGLTVGDYAFDGHRITSITFAEGSLVRSIGAYAFRFGDYRTQRNADKAISIPASVTSVGDGAFANWYKLSVTIESGENVLAFGNGVFADCEIDTLTLPKNVTALPNFFSGLLVGEIVVDKENPVFLSLDGVLYTKNANNDPDVLLLYPSGKTGSSYEIPNTVTAIANMAFAYTGVSSVTIPSSVKTIGDAAFCYTSRLSTITIPSSVTYIGKEAFVSSGIGTVVFEDGDTPLTIGERAFFQTKITSIVLPERVKAIEAYAFYKTSKATTLSLGGVETIGDHAFDTCLASGEVILPATLRSLGEYAFNNAYNVTAFTFAPNAKLETIGEYAFAQCRFASFTIPASVKTVADFAFMRNSNLTELLFEDGDVDLVFGINCVGGYSILYGTSVTSIAFPSRLVRIGNNACQFAYSLTSVTFGENSRLTTIGEGAFRSSHLTSVTIPASVKNTDVIGIGKDAFNGCYLESVTFEPGTEPLTIGESAFSASSWAETPMTSVTLPARLAYFTDSEGNVTAPLANGREVFNSLLASFSVESGCKVYGAMDGVLYNAEMTELITCPKAKEGVVVLPATLGKIAANAFYECQSVTAIDFTASTSLEEIGDKAFYWCNRLESVSLPDSVQKIGYQVFGQCQGMTSLKLPASMTEFDRETILDCMSLTSLTINEGINYKTVDGVLFTADGKTLVYYLKTLPGTSYTVPEGVETIAEFAFNSNPNLTALVLPASLTRLEKSALNGCTNLSDVTFTPGDKPLVIGATAFSNTGLSSFAVPARVVSIDKGAFYGVGLTTLTFEADSKLGYIGEYAFYSTSLTSLDLPASLRELGDLAFARCQNLTTVVLPEGIVKIGNSLFENCTRLESVTFPSTLTELGNYTFRILKTDAEEYHYTSFLRHVIFAKGSRIQVIPVGTFARCAALESIELPASLLEIPDRDNSIVGYDGNAGLFAGCTSLRRVTFEQGSRCARIGAYAFADTAMESFTIPESVSAIGECAFYQSALTSMMIPSTVTSLGMSAFEGCKDLSSVKLGGGVRALPFGVFANCPALHELCLPAAVVTVHGDAFYNSEHLTLSLAPDSTMNLLHGVLYDAEWNICVFPESMTEYEIPRTVTKLPSDFFGHDGAAEHLTKITVEEGNPSYVEENGILYNADKSKILFIGASTFEINEDVLNLISESDLLTLLSSSLALERITVAEGVDGLLSVGGVLYNTDREILVFPKALTEYTIPAALSAIPKNMFYENTKLKTVTAEARGEGDPGLSIAENAFAYATSLESVSLPANLKAIDFTAFEGCTALYSVTFAGFSAEVYEPYETILMSLDACEKLTEVNINTSDDYMTIDGILFAYDPETESWSFFYYPMAKTVFTIPADLTVLPTILDCPLKTVTFEKDKDGKEVTVEGVNTLTIDCALSELTSLETVELPSRLTEISDYAFGNCTALKEIHLPARLTKISDNAFENCTALKEIHLPATLKYVGASAFSGWTAEQTVVVDLTKTETANLFNPGWLDGCEATVKYKAE